MTVISTSTETIMLINPAFLQEIKDSNPDLWETQLQLRRACNAPPTSELIGQLARVLDDFRDQLALQFALEESYGYQVVRGTTKILASVISTEEIARAQQQHSSLYLEISQLAEQSEEIQYRGATVESVTALVRAVQAFDQMFCEHEELENELIDQSFDLV